MSNATPSAPRKPRFILPPNATDCHFHVYDNDPRFPAHKMDRALAVHRHLGIGRGILVQALPETRAVTLQGLALAGANYRAITPILEVPSEKEVQALHEAGYRGVRFTFGFSNPRHGRPPDIATVRATVERIAPLGWHTDFHLASPQHQIDMMDFLRSLPVPFVIDSMGRLDVAQGVEQPGFQALLELVRMDNGWVKLAGCDRHTKGPPFHEALPFARALIAASPDRVIWGSDWPHPNNPWNPDDANLVDLIPLMTSDPVQQRKLLVDNPARLVGF